MERRGVPAPRTNGQGFPSASSAFSPSAPDLVHGPSSPGATGGSSQGQGLGAAAAAIADIERQLERLITQRKTERSAAAAHFFNENGNNDQRKKAKTGAASREEDKDSSGTESTASDAQGSNWRNLDEDLLIGMLGIPLIGSEVARGRSPRPHSPPTMSTSPPMTPTPTAHHTPLTPDMAANAADLVLRADLSQGDTHCGDDTPPAIATESVWQAAEAAHKPPSPLMRSLTSPPAPPLPEQLPQPVMVAALRREIMGEVKTELLMEVARRDKENQGKLHELEIENRELKQELHGLLREMREDRRRKEREREERNKRRQHSAGQRTKRGRSGSDDSEGCDVESSDDDTSSSDQEAAEPKRRGTKRSRGSSEREPVDRHSDKSDSNSSKRKRGKAPARKAERHAGEDEADVQQRSAQARPTAEPAVALVMTPLRADTRGSRPGADRWSHSSGSSGEETIAAAATGPDEDRNADDGRPSRSTVWRRKKGHRAAEEIEHDNQERWQMRVDQLRAFVKEHGHCRVPKSHPNRPLYTWTQNVRQRWRRGAVPESKIRDLVALGMQHPAEEFGGAAVRRGSQQQRPAIEPAPGEDVATSRDQDSKAVDRKSSTNTGRPRAVKRSRRQKRPSSATTKVEGGEDGKRSQSRASDDDYAALSEQDHEDDEEEEEEQEEEEEEEQEEKYTRRLRQRRSRRSEEAKPHTNAVDGVVTRRKAKSLTSQAEEMKESVRGDKRKPTTESTDKESPKKAKLAERKSASGTKSEGEDVKSQKQKKPIIDESEEEEASAKRSDYEDDGEGERSEGDEIPESHVNQKWLKHFEALKAWQKQHNLNRPNRKQSASLGRWSDEQLNRMRSGMLLPWRRKLLDAIGFFASPTESS